MDMSTGSNSFGPKDLGGIFQDTATIYRASVLQFLVIAAIVEVVITAVGLAGEALFTSGLQADLEAAGLNDPDAEVEFETVRQIILDHLPAVLLGGAVTALIGFVAGQTRVGALIHGISEQRIRRPIRVDRAFVFTFSRFGPLIGAGLLAGIPLLLLTITIIGIPIAVFLGVRWQFIFQATVLEGLSPVQAMQRSASLVQDTWWRAFGIMLLVVFIAAIVTGVLGSILGLIPVVGQSIVSVLVVPFVVIAHTVLYYDLRVRRDGPESFNVETLGRELELPEEDIPATEPMERATDEVDDGGER